MELKYLDEQQAQKYSTLDIEKIAAKENFKKVAESLFDGRKVLKAEKAQTEFKYEYDEILEEVEEIRDYEISELKELLPETWKFISKIKGSAIFKSVDKGLLTDGLKTDTNVEKKIESIKSNEILDSKQKKDKIALRKTMQKEIQNFEKVKDEKWTKDIVWKVWQVSEGERVTKILENKGTYERYMEKCRLIGLEKLDKISELYSEKYYDD